MLIRASQIALKFALSAFVGVVLIDPGDHILHLKLPLLILILTLWTMRAVLGSVPTGSFRVCAAILLFVFILPGLASIVAILRDALPLEDPHVQLIKEFSVVLILPVILSEKIDLTTQILRWSYLIAIFTLALAALSLFSPIMFMAVRDYAVASENALISQRGLLGLGIGSFYYKTVSVLVFPIAYHLRRLLSGQRRFRSAFLTLFLVAAVMCSDSRAMLIGVFTVIAFFLTQKLWSRLGTAPALLFLFIITALPAAYFAAFFQSDESSNAAKLGHIRSYAVLFDDHPTYLLWGQGADSEFYTEGFRAKTTLTELTYLDLVRWFGIPVAALILLAVCYPVIGLKRRADAVSYLAVPYVAYVFEAASNPLLVCSFGAMIVSAMWGASLIGEGKEKETASARKNTWFAGRPITASHI